MAWKERFGAFALEEEVALQTATQQVVSGTVCGPALVRIEGFRAIHGEVLFVEMEPEMASTSYCLATYRSSSAVRPLT